MSSSDLPSGAAQQRDPINPIAVGASIGELRVVPTKIQLFMFSAITWNRHQIHFNKDQALAEGFADVAVHRGLIGNFLARLVTTWAGANGTLTRLRWTVLRTAYPDQELTCSGEVTAIAVDGVQQVECSLHMANHDLQAVATGSATVLFSTIAGVNS